MTRSATSRAGFARIQRLTMSWQAGKDIRLYAGGGVPMITWQRRRTGVVLAGVFGFVLLSQAGFAETARGQEPSATRPQHVGPSTQAAVTSACRAPFSPETVPSPGSDSYLNDISATAPGNRWAVGRQGPPDQGWYAPLVVTDTGSGWTERSFPLSDGLLTNVFARNADDAWVSGHTSNFELFVARWSAGEWAIPQMPRFSDGALSPYNGLQIANVAPDMAWMTGSVETSSGDLRGQIARWDGTAWRQVEHPAAGHLVAVDASSKSDAWVVGADIQHWNGAKWKRVPRPPGNYWLEDVTAVNPSVAFASGRYLDETQDPVMLAWDGRVWTHLPPLPLLADKLSGSPYNILDVSARSARDAWFVGSTAVWAYPAATSTTEQR